MDITYTIKTSRLILRALNENDYDIWKEAHLSMLAPKNKWDVANSQFTNFSQSDFKKILRVNSLNRKNESFIDYAIIDKKTKKYIGRVSLMNCIRSVTQSSFIGYVLFNNYWGQGFAAEAMSGLFQLAFTKHKLHRVVAGIEPENLRSIKFAKKLGMRREGVSKRVVLLRGQWRDLVQFALTSDDLNIKWKGQITQRRT
jgi:RimJ/RimL family protein N-acetyltransferase